MDQTPSGDELRPDDEPQQPPEAASSEPVERDAWDSFVHTDEAEAGAPGEEGAPVAAPADVSWEPASPTARRGRRRGGGGLTSLLLVILALGLMAATAWGILQYRQRAMTQNAAQQAVALIATGAPADMAPRVADIQADLAAGHSAAAAQKIAELGTLLAQQQGVPAQPGAQPGGPAEAAAGPLPDEAYQDLPPDAATFFRQHEDLYRRFLEMCAVARGLKEKGVNVDELRRMRNAVTEAARLGRLDAVEKKMSVMMDQLQKQTGRGGGDGRGPLAIKAQRLKEVAQRAEAQGRDIRPALALMKQAEQAAQAGRMDEAAKYIDQALDAVKKARRIAGGRGFGPRDGRQRLMLGGGGRRENPLLPFVRVLLGVMSAEEGDLKAVNEQLLHMRELLTGETVTETTPPPAPPASPQVEALKPMVERALSEMQTLAQRRQELTREMNRQRGGKLPPPTGPGQGMTREQRQGMIALVLERLAGLIDRIRAMPENEYMQQKGPLLSEIMQTVLRPPPPEPAQQTQQPPQPPAFPKDPEQRIRAKMLQASAVLKQWELAGKDTKPVEALFAEARKALYDKKLDVAEQKVDEGRKLLGLEPDKPATGGAAAPGPTPPVDPAAKIDLRGN